MCIDNLLPTLEKHIALHVITKDSSFPLPSSLRLWLAHTCRNQSCVISLSRQVRATTQQRDWPTPSPEPWSQQPPAAETPATTSCTTRRLNTRGVSASAKHGNWCSWFFSSVICWHAFFWESKIVSVVDRTGMSIGSRMSPLPAQH